MTYRLASTGSATTQVDVVSEINLAGALAQFGKAGVIQEVANRITAEFVRNFEARLAPPAEAPSPASPAAPSGGEPKPSGEVGGKTSSLAVGNLLWSVLRDWIGALFRRLTGRATLRTSIVRVFPRLLGRRGLRTRVQVHAATA
jgi:uncharacterized protein